MGHHRYWEEMQFLSLGLQPRRRSTILCKGFWKFLQWVEHCGRVSGHSERGRVKLAFWETCHPKIFALQTFSTLISDAKFNVDYDFVIKNCLCMWLNDIAKLWMFDVERSKWPKGQYHTNKYIILCCVAQMMTVVKQKVCKDTILSFIARPPWR